MSDNDNHDERTVQRERDSYTGTRRRTFLKYTGASIVGASLLSTPTAAVTDDIANGPFRREYVGEPQETEPLCGGGNEFEGEVEGSAETEEIPRGQPAPGSSHGGGGGPSQRAVRGDAIEVATEYDGLGAIDVRGIVPSDSQLGVGPNHVVEGINSRWAIIEKESGEQTCEITLDEWFANVSPFIPEGEGEPEGEDDDENGEFFEDYNIFDPQVHYDRQYDRFLLACVESSLETGRGAMLLSVSDDSDPNGTWYNYRIPPVLGADQTQVPPGLVDYPQLGHGDDGVYLTENFFAVTDDGELAFQEATMALLDQSTVGRAGPTEAWHFSDLLNPDGSLAFTLQPATQPNLGGEYDDTYHLINSKFFQGKTLTLWDVNYTAGTPPTIANSALRVQPYHNPTDAKQPDTEEVIDMGDTRLMNVSYDTGTGSLWTAHTISGGRARWYEVDPDTNSVVQSGNFKRAGYPTFYPTIAAQDGNAVFVYNTASPRRGKNPGYASVEVAGRTADFQQGVMEDYEVVKNGVDDYDYQDGPTGEPDNGPQVMRWGDYNGVSVDPDGESIWVVSQYASTPDEVENEPEYIRDNYYTTRIAEISFET
jgi:hypothetical protein